MDRNIDRQFGSLGGALNRLERLLDEKNAAPEADGEAPLPVLEEVVNDVAAEPVDEAPLVDTEDPATDTEVRRLRSILERLSEQLETDLRQLAAKLKTDTLQTVRDELATAYDIDPQRLDFDGGGSPGRDAPPGSQGSG